MKHWKHHFENPSVHAQEENCILKRDHNSESLIQSHVLRTKRERLYIVHTAINVIYSIKDFREKMMLLLKIDKNSEEQ